MSFGKWRIISGHFEFFFHQVCHIAFHMSGRTFAGYDFFYQKDIYSHELFQNFTEKMQQVCRSCILILQNNFLKQNKNF